MTLPGHALFVYPLIQVAADKLRRMKKFEKRRVHSKSKEVNKVSDPEDLLVHENPEATVLAAKKNTVHLGDIQQFLHRWQHSERQSRYLKRAELSTITVVKRRLSLSSQSVNPQGFGMVIQEVAKVCVEAVVDIQLREVWPSFVLSQLSFLTNVSHRITIKPIRGGLSPV